MIRYKQPVKWLDFTINKHYITLTNTYKLLKFIEFVVEYYIKLKILEIIENPASTNQEIGSLQTRLFIFLYFLCFFDSQCIKVTRLHIRRTYHFILIQNYTYLNNSISCRLL